MQENQPGEVIQPQGQAAPPQVTSPVVTAPSAQSQPVGSPDFYRPDDASVPQPSELPAATIQWEADEYIAHDKSKNWYIAATGGCLLIGGIIYLLTKDVITTLLASFALIGLAAFSARHPRRQQFAVGLDGIQVGSMFYPFADFRSFSVVEDQVGSSLMLVSLKRFVPAINVYVPREYEESVINLVASILPMESHKPDLVERFISSIRF